ncbi:syntaxin-7 isoform X2 [Lingula anatina]|uniref:Syntaxin-7 isoform X2 n=1 Tax=Lingula anatina TaxID=7574 RepID=A0A1S3HFV1_LINAN|nr:syntaxin-7 isoform X2 [Lingula anatina]|eukprot:XP_013384958.1 syntaxin-7 isoform X2 [Lingula anatina]
MSGRRDDFGGFRSSARPYRDNPGLGEYRDNPGYGNFSQLYDQVSSNVFTINNHATSLERALRQIGSDRDSKELRDRIHETELKTNKIIAETTKLFKQLSGIRGIERQQKLSVERIQNDFKETIQRYSELQKKAAEKVKTIALRQRTQSSEGLGFGASDDDKVALMEQDELRRQELQAQEQLIEDDLAVIQEREERIRELEADILDINEIFRDLGTLVYEQGEMIDNIEDHVSKAHDNVEAGNEQLVKAASYQKKARKKICICVIVLIIILAIIAVIIYVSVPKNK